MLNSKKNEGKAIAGNKRSTSMLSTFQNILKGRFSPIFLLIILVLSISFVTRLALLLKTGKGFDPHVKNIIGSFALGAFFDLAMAAYLIIPFIFQIWLSNEKMYERKWKWVVIASYLIVIGIFLFTNLVPADFNAELKKGVTAYIILRFFIFIFLTFKDYSFRKKWRTAVLYFDFFLAIFLLLFNAVSEWFFWEEFSVRYNFIAVDYLVYTNEVFGNIKESYPIPAIVSVVLVFTAGIFFLVRPVIKRSAAAASSFSSRTIIAAALLAICAINYFGVKEDWRNFSKNEYANELAGNGIFQ
ncbi:MAG TPA: LTA synthase family protein, partial [Segetibacter sp.]